MIVLFSPYANLEETIGLAWGIVPSKFDQFIGSKCSCCIFKIIPAQCSACTTLSKPEIDKHGGYVKKRMNVL